MKATFAVKRGIFVDVSLSLIMMQLVFIST